MTEKQKKEVIGQAQFIRAWRYFRLAQKYGGLPLIKGLQSAIMADADKLNIPRSSTKETFEFICEVICPQDGKKKERTGVVSPPEPLWP